MSQETQIGSLGGGISDEDSKLVDSILNDLNGHQNEGQQQQQQQQQQPQQQQQQQQQMPRDQNGNELTHEQIKQIQMQRQMAMQQQQLMAQQQQMQQQQQMAHSQNTNKEGEEGKESNLIPSNKNDLIDNIKNESKSIILVILLSIIMNLEQVDNLFKLQSGLFISENGSLNMQAIFVKALVIGSIYYLVKLYLL